MSAAEVSAELFREVTDVRANIEVVVSIHDELVRLDRLLGSAMVCTHDAAGKAVKSGSLSSGATASGRPSSNAFSVSDTRQ